MIIYLLKKSFIRRRICYLSLGLIFFFPLLAFPQSANNFTVVLDAGHGGKDPGNTGNGFKEKDIALNIALKVGKELEKHTGIQVIYTRKSDVFVTLKERAEKANKAKADLFVSIHLNAFGGSKPHGSETYVLGTHRNKDNLDVAMRENSVIYLEEDYKETYDGFDPKSPESYIGMTLMQEEYLDQSILLADFIQNAFTLRLKRFNRGVKKAGFLVLRETYMPSVLVETGFLTNLAEGRYLNSAQGQQEMAVAIADGVVKYKSALNLGSDLAGGEMEAAADQTIYKVQLAAGANPVKTTPQNFSGLEGVERVKEGSIYRYYYGSTVDRAEADLLLKQAKNKGVNGAFLVGYKNGKRINVN